MHYRQRSALFAAPWLIIGAAAVGASGGMTVADLDKPELLIATLSSGRFPSIARMLSSPDTTRGRRTGLPLPR